MFVRTLLLLVPAALMAAPRLDPALTANLSGLSNQQIMADPQGNIVIAGQSRDCSLPVVKPLSTCGPLWIAKLDPTGRTLIFATYLAAAMFVQGAGVDHDGNILVAGVTGTAGLPVVNPAQAALRGPSNFYVLKLASDGSRMIYATYLGGSGHDTLRWVQVDPAGSVYLFGYSDSADFPSTQSLKSVANGFTVIAKLTPHGRLAYGASMPYSFAFRGFQVDSAGVVWFNTDTETLKLSADGGTLARTALPAWTRGVSPWILPTRDEGYWLTGGVSNGLLPVTSNAAQPLSGAPAHVRFESGQFYPPARRMLAHQVNGFGVDPFERFRLYAATDGGLFRSEDNGWTWDLVRAGVATAIVVDPFDQNCLYVASGPVWRSINRGETWTATGGVSVTSIAADPNVPGLLYATGQSFYRSPNSGQNWIQYDFPTDPSGGTPSSVLFTIPYQVRADPMNPNRIYILTYTRCLGFCPGSVSLYRSDDVGNTLRKIDAFFELDTNSDLQIDPASGDIFLRGGKGITVFRGGDLTSPTRILNDGVTALAVDPIQSGSVAVALADGSLVTSLDGGANWSTAGKSTATALRMTFSDGGVLNLSQAVPANDAFLFKFDSRCNITYGSYFGGGSVTVEFVATGGNGHLFIGGTTDNTGFTAEFDNSGTLLFSTLVGGPGQATVKAGFPVADGSILLSGFTTGSFPPLQPSALGAGDTFLVRLR